MSLSTVAERGLEISIANKKTAEEVTAKINASNYAIIGGGVFTTVGGDTTEIISNASVQAGDLVLLSIVNRGTNEAQIVTYATTAGVITVTTTANPGADAKWQYFILRAE